MDHLIEEATEMARLESNEVELDRQPHHIGEAINQTLESATRILDQHPVKLDVPTQLPPVEFDLELIINVLRQLVENAASTPRPTPRCIFRSSTRTRKLLLTSPTADLVLTSSSSH